MIRLILRLVAVGGGLAWVIDRVLASRAGNEPPEPIRTTIAIDAPIDQVWEIMTNIEGQPRWMDDLKSVRILTPPPIGIGTRAEGDVRIFGIGVLDPITVTAFEPPHRFGVRHEGVFSGDGLVELEAGVDGSTVARWVETIVPPMFPHAGAALLSPILRWIFQRDLANLRELIETRPGRS